MPMTPVPSVALTPVAYFPEGYFLENLAVRADGSALVTTVMHKELWCVRGPEPRADVPPVLVATFDSYTMGVVEAEPDVFIVGLSDQKGSTRESHLARVDLNGWTPGEPVKPEIILTFDERARWLNGACKYGLRTLRAATARQNVASQRVLAKAGFVVAGPADPADLGGKPGTWYQRELSAG